MKGSVSIVILGVHTASIRADCYDHPDVASACEQVKSGMAGFVLCIQIQFSAAEIQNTH